MLIPLGILAASGAGPVGGDYELISTTLISSPASSVTFNVSSFAANYRHLQIRYTARTDHALSSNNLGIRFNGDMGSNYAYLALEAGYSGSSVVSGGQTLDKGLLGVSAGSATTANVFAGGVVDILDAFSASKNKTVRSLSGNRSNDSVLSIRRVLWMSTAPINSITIDNWMASNLVTGSRFSIYGIKG